MNEETTNNNEIEIKNSIKKVLVLGSGGLAIGQAGEFDYSGSQSLIALKEEGIKTVLINPNIATYQTSEGVADKTYFLPVDTHFVTKIIEKERPDGIFLGFGGQTGLNCGLDLEEKGILARFNVQVLGTPVKTIRETEDRDLFIQKLNEINIKTAKSFAVNSVEKALEAADKIGYPIMLRAAFALGGKGSGVARNKEELDELAKKAFASSPQVLIEEFLGGWKEIEYEVVRDKFDNCITVCNMENFDPMGIHTGESIVVAPSQTLTNREYHKLREIAIKTIKHLGIIGECNIQYALDPQSEDYRVIEVNARLSRSSALASKATGYPLAFVAAKLGLGYGLPDIKNSVTQVTKACFEPALDYVVIKVPRWDLQKFKEVDKRIGSEMKSVGEVMSIGRKFEEALQKALRMINIGVNGIVQNTLKIENIEEEIRNPTDKRVFAVADALKQGISVDQIFEWSGIDKFFLYKIKIIIDCEKQMQENELTPELLKRAKQLGFSDYQIARIKNTNELEIRNLRKQYFILPSIKQIDTLAGEFPAKTNYLYITYNGTENDVLPSENGVIVLGSGAYRIGSSVEFDWCCVNSVLTAKAAGHNTIMINYNPETVSTDYDMCDKLYFDEISFERVMDIYEFENPNGVIVSMGGQIPNNLALPLHGQGVKILGTSPENIDNAEDRHKFSKLLDDLKIDQPEWKELTSLEEAKIFANKVKYPVLIRPSYVLSGAAMTVVFNDENLEKYLNKATEISGEFPVVMSKFIEGAKEIEIDAVANKGELVIWAITEHVENAGVHSGDATMVLPAQKLYQETIRRVKKAAREIASALQITGPFNIQFIAKENQIKVIECNLRASRSFPFCSKVLKKNFIDIATKCILGKDVPSQTISGFELDYVGVKAPQFSFSRLKGADPTLGVEMASTGEVGCLGEDLEEAFLKAMISTGFKIPKKNILLSTGHITKKAAFLESAKTLEELGYCLYATGGTGKFLNEQGINVNILNWPLDKTEPNALTYIKEKKIDLVINIPKSHEKEELSNDYIIRRTAIDFSIPLITNIQCANLVVSAIKNKKIDDLKIKSWDEY